MRVLMISWEYPPYVVGGLGKHVAELLPALAGQDGIDLHLLTPRWQPSADMEYANGAIVHRVTLPDTDEHDFYTCGLADQSHAGAGCSGLGGARGRFRSGPRPTIG